MDLEDPGGLQDMMPDELDRPNTESWKASCSNTMATKTCTYANSTIEPNKLATDWARNTASNFAATSR